MAGLNKVMLIGHLGRDPEVRYTPAGLAVANFTMATTEKFKEEERTEWHRIVAFDKLAEIMGQYLSKGKQVYIEGRLQTRDWQDKDGNKRTTTEIVANQMVMLGSRQDGGGGGQRGNGYQPKGEPSGQRQGYSGQNQGYGQSNQGPSGLTPNYGGPGQGAPSGNQGYRGGDQAPSGPAPGPSGRPPEDDIPF